MAFITTMPPPPASYKNYIGNITTANTDDVRKKQYDYPGAFVSHGECIEAPVDPDIVKLTAADVDLIRKKQYNYPKAIISHGERIEDIPETPIKKKYMLTSVIDFFKQRQKFGRYPFLHTPNI